MTQETTGPGQSEPELGTFEGLASYPQPCRAASGWSLLWQVDAIRSQAGSNRVQIDPSVSLVTGTLPSSP